MSHEEAFERWQNQEEDRRNPLADEPQRNGVPTFRAVGGAYGGNSYNKHSGADKIEHPAIPEQDNNTTSTQPE